MADRTKLPKGRFNARIVGQGIQTAKTGTQQVVFEVEVDGHEGTHYVYLFCSAKAAPYTIKKLAAAGFTGTSLTQIIPGEPGHQDLTGNEVTVYNKHEEDLNGDLKDKLDIATGGGIKSATAAEVRAGANEFDKLLRAENAGKAPAPAAATSATEDDIPF